MEQQTIFQSASEEMRKNDMYAIFCVFSNCARCRYNVLKHIALFYNLNKSSNPQRYTKKLMWIKF